MAKFHELGVLESPGYGNRQLSEGSSSSTFCDSNNVNPNVTSHRQQLNRTTPNVFLAPDTDSSFSFVLSDVPKTSNAQSKSAHLQSTSRPTHQWEVPRFPADDSCDYSSSKTLPSSSRHRLSSVEFPPSPDQSQFVSSDNIGYDYASSSKTLPSSRHRLSSVEFPPSPEHGNYTTLPSSVVEERKLLQMVRHKPDSHPVSNLIDFGTPPNSPFNNKLMTSQQQQSFQYSTGNFSKQYLLSNQHQFFHLVY